MKATYPYRTSKPRQWTLLKPEARRMRHEPTLAEDVLWEELRGRKLGTRFRRQHAIDRFIVDFVCFPERLVIELDGGIHLSQIGADEQRDANLRATGFDVLRFPNEAVLGDIRRVVDRILSRLDELRSNAPRNSPSPLGEGAGG